MTTKLLPVIAVLAKYCTNNDVWYTNSNPLQWRRYAHCSTNSWLVHNQWYRRPHASLYTYKHTSALNTPSEKPSYNTSWINIHILSLSKLIDWLGFNGTFSTNRLYVPLISTLQLKSEINKKVDKATIWEYIQ